MRIGVDLGGTKTEVVLLADDGTIVFRERVPTPAQEGYRAILDTVIAEVERARDAAVGPCSVGVGIPGCVDGPTGRVKGANTTALNGRSLRTDLEAALGHPVAVANDANCFAVAETRAGAARGARVVFGVILGTGTGGGVVLGGEAWNGHQGIAGEWGHSPVAESEPDGPEAPLCWCGQRGCVETRLSGPALARDYARLAGHEAGAPVDATEIERRAEAGEAAARRALERYLSFFGRALAPVLQILDPEVVVLGGGVSRMACLYSQGPAAVEMALFNPRLDTPIRRHELGDSAGVLGAAWLPLAP